MEQRNPDVGAYVPRPMGKGVGNGLSKGLARNPLVPLPLEALYSFVAVVAIEHLQRGFQLP